MKAKNLLLTLAVGAMVMGCNNGSINQTSAPLKTAADSASFYLGYINGKGMQQMGMKDMNMGAFVAGMNSAKQDKKVETSQEAMEMFLNSYFQKLFMQKAQENAEKGEKFLKENGLTEDKIKLIYDYDRMIFNSDRRFYEHALQPSDNFFEFVCDNSTTEITTVEDFMNSIHSIALAQALEEFGFEVQLIVFLMYRGYTGKEISEITGIPRYTISRRLSKLEKVYKSKK